MKYYYLTHDGSFRTNVNKDKDFDRINRDRYKIVITRINGDFHVLVCKNGVYEKEKRVFSYLDLVKYLRKVAFTIYFVNVSYETVYLINSLIRSDEEIGSKEVVEEKKEAIYTIGNGFMYKLEAYIKRSILKKAIYALYGKEVSEDKYHEESLTDFIGNSELFEIYQLPFIERGGRFLIPNYSYSEPKPFYMLSGICAKSGEVISLSSTDFKNILMIGTINRELVSELLSNVEIRIIEQHTLASVDHVVDFLEKFHDGEDNNAARLRFLRDHIEEARDNRIVFDYIKLLGNQEENNKSEEKGLINK